MIRLSDKATNWQYLDDTSGRGKNETNQIKTRSTKAIWGYPLTRDFLNREESIRHGHPSTLHPWWARRTLTAARAAKKLGYLLKAGQPLKSSVLPALNLEIKS